MQTNHREVSLGSSKGILELGDLICGQLRCRLSRAIQINGRQPFTNHLNCRSQATIQLGHDFSHRHVGRLVVHLDAESLSQAQTVGSECLTVLVGQIQSGLGRQDGFTHQLAGLWAVLAKHLHATHSGHVVGVADRGLIQSSACSLDHIAGISHDTK